MFRCHKKFEETPSFLFCCARMISMNQTLGPLTRPHLMTDASMPDPSALNGGRTCVLLIRATPTL